MNLWKTVVLAGALATLPVQTRAQLPLPARNEHGMIERDPATLHFTMLPMAKGLVEGIDWKRGEMTVTHAHLYDANVVPGTTTFAVGEAAMLDSVQPGDSIYLVADWRDGRLTLLSLTARHPE